MRRIAPLALSLSALAFAAPAQAATVVPPGNSGINQYFETVPGVGGGTGTHNHKGTHNSAVNPHTRQALKNLGANGTGAAAAADATAPAVGSPGGSASPISATPQSSPTSTSGSTTKPSGSNGSSGTSSSSGASGTSSHPSSAPAASGTGSSPFSSLVRAVSTGSSSGGMGVVQPLLLLAVLLGAGGYIWHRRRRSA